MANDLRGEAPIFLGGKEYKLRFSFGALRELKAAFGQPVVSYLRDKGENLDLDDLVTIVEVGLRSAKNPIPEEELLDLMVMADIPSYAEAMKQAFGTSANGDKPPKKPQEDGSDPLPPTESPAPPETGTTSS